MHSAERLHLPTVYSGIEHFEELSLAFPTRQVSVATMFSH